MSYLKYCFLIVAVCSVLTLPAQMIEGRVTAGDGRPVSGALLSDGHSFAVTDGAGHYQLELAPEAATVYLHQDSEYRAEPFYYLLTPERTQYDFSLTERPKTGDDKVNIVVIGDPETDNVDYMKEIAAYIEQHPEVDFVLNAGDINGRAGMLAHRTGLTSESFPRPVYYVIGNHDIVKRAPGEADCYAENIAPWYYSLECKGILFITAPMYASWGAPLPYDMKAYGDWLRKLLEHFPASQPKVLMAHDIVDLVGDEVPTHGEPVNLDDCNFRAILYGHKHMNVVMRYESGRKAYCTGTATRGGIGFVAPGFRTVTFTPDGGSRSALHYAQLDGLLKAGCDGGSLWATAGNSGDEVNRVVITGKDGSGVELQQTTALGWYAPVPDGNWQPVRATATTASGRSFSAAVELSGLRLLQALPQEAAMADLLIDGDTLFAAVVDDAEAEQGGVYALDRHSGKIKWFHPTRYSIRNNMAQDRDRLYLIDARGNILAIAKADGTRVWNNPADLKLLSPSASGVILADGVVVGGYGALLRGVDCATGRTLWENQDWTERTPGEDKLAAAGSTVYVISQLNGLCAHDAHTGRLLWQFQQPFLSGTVCVGDGVLFVKGENEFFKLDAATGARLASRQLKGLKSASAPILWRELVIFGTAGRGVVALKQDDLSEAWNFLPEDALVATTYYAEGKPCSVDATVLPDAEQLVIGAGDGFLHRLEAATGKELERRLIGAPVPGKGVRAGDGHKYFIDMTGKIVEWD